MKNINDKHSGEEKINLDNLIEFHDFQKSQNGTLNDKCSLNLGEHEMETAVGAKSSPR